MGAVTVKTTATTKPILVLLLGCLPLAGLTVASFVGIGDVDSRLPWIGEGDLVPTGASVSVPTAQDLKGDEMLRVAVAEREFLAGEPLPERAVDANSLYLDSMPADWKHWSDATDLVGQVLTLEEDVIGARLPQLESAVKRIGTIQDECRKKDPAGSAPLIRVLDRRIMELRAEIAFLTNCKIVEDRVAEAQAAFGTGEFSDSYNKYDAVLTEHKDILTSEALENMTYDGVLAARKNAGFWRDVDNLPLTSPVTEEPSTQRDSLVGFLDSYQGMQGDLEATKLTRVKQKLVTVNEELRRREMNEAAQMPISALGKYDGRPFGEGLAAAAQIAETYPANRVRGQLQHHMLRWLARSLPAKQLDEPAKIEEVETTSGVVLRGFFEGVPDAGGGVIGYKNYPTAEERQNPTRNVGRYPAADLRGVPTVSVPRQCVQAYESARVRLLAGPGDRDSWTALQRCCDSAEVTLNEYRRKPGSSGELLSFNETSQFVRNVLTPAAWSQMEAVWGK